MELEPIDPETALELYLEEKSMSAAEATVRSHRSRLGHFVRWCDQRDITNLNDLTGRKLQEFRLWRRNDGDLSKVSVKTQIDTLRVFARWLGTIDAVDPDLYQKVVSPDVTPDENSRDVKLDVEAAEAILSRIETYDAPQDHVVMALLWHSMLRIGGARAIDLEDYDPSSNVSKSNTDRTRGSQSKISTMANATSPSPDGSASYSTTGSESVAHRKPINTDGTHSLQPATAVSRLVPFGKSSTAHPPLRVRQRMST